MDAWIKILIVMIMFSMLSVVMTLLVVNPFFGLGFDFTQYYASRNYKDFPDVEQDSRSLRAYISFNLDRDKE